MPKHLLVYYEMGDKALWELLLKGDLKASEVLYVKYYDLLLNYGLKYCSNEDLVKDCIQDLFVKLYFHRNLPKVEYVRSYLLKSLAHIIFDRYRNKKNAVSLVNLTFNVFDVVSDDFDESVADEDLKVMTQLKYAHAALTEKQKHIIYLRFVQKLSYKEIAAVLDINVQSAMNSVHRAIEKLRNHMSRY